MNHTPAATKQPGMKERYSRAGYVIAEGIFPINDLQTLCNGFRRVLETQQNEFADPKPTLDDLILKCEKEDHRIVYNSSQSVGSSASGYQLLGSSRIFDVIAEVTGFETAELHVMPLYLIVQLPSDDRFDYVWHQDSSYYPWCEDFLTLWFPVNRSTSTTTGTISVIPQSHQIERRESNTFLRDGFFRQIESKVTDLEEKSEAILNVELGDCCIMHGRTVHRSVANRSSSPRVAGVLRIARLEPRQTYERDRFYCSHKS